MLLHTQQSSLHPALHQCVWREDVTTHTTVESPSSSSSVCVEGGCYYTPNSGVSIQLFISVCGGRMLLSLPVVLLEYDDCEQWKVS